MLIVRSTCSDASACGGDKARETKRSAIMAGEGGWKPPDREGASLSASEHDSASLHYNPQWPTSQRWRSLQSSMEQRSRAVEGLGGVTDESAHRKRTRANREASPASIRPRSGGGQRGMGKHNHAIRPERGLRGVHSSEEAGESPWSKGTPLQTCCHQKEGARLRAKLSTTVKLATGPGKPGPGEPVNRSIFRVGSFTERRRPRGHFVITPCWTAWTGVKHREMAPNLDSPTVKFAGEPSTGNLYTRFDEGRGGLAFRLAPSSTLLVNLSEFKFLALARRFFQGSQLLYGALNPFQVQSF